MICVIVSQALSSGDAEWEEGTQAPFLHPAGGAPTVQECSVLIWDTRAETLRPPITASPSPKLCLFLSFCHGKEWIGGSKDLSPCSVFSATDSSYKRESDLEVVATVGIGRVGLGCFPALPLASLVIRLWPSTIDLAG